MKVQYIAALLLLALVAIGTTSCTEEAKAEPGKQVYCPVMTDNKIDPDLYVDVEGKRIYLCCSGCIEPVTDNPEKYITQMEADGIILEEAPTAGEG